MLRRLLPTGILVGRGFISGHEEASTQIDLLVLKQGKPTLFRDGDLAIVTPDVPCVIAEVKTKLEGEKLWYEAASKLAKNGELCKRIAKNKPWLGIFVYEGNSSQAKLILNTLSQVYKQTGVPINCVTCGHDVFVRYWPLGEREPSDDPGTDANREYWRAYDLTQLAASYFVSNLVDACCNVDRSETDYAWFALRDGKRRKMLDEIRAEISESNH